MLAWTGSCGDPANFLSKRSLHDPVQVLNRRSCGDPGEILSKRSLHEELTDDRLIGGVLVSRSCEIRSGAGPCRTILWNSLAGLGVNIVRWPEAFAWSCKGPCESSWKGPCEILSVSLHDLVQILVRRSCGNPVEILSRGPCTEILEILCIGACMKALLGCSKEALV